MSSSRLIFRVYSDVCKLQKRYYQQNARKIITNKTDIKTNKNTHCYNDLFPWKTISELAKHLASTISYSKGGLIALNKPFGIKIHGHDKPGTRNPSGQRFIIPSIPDCDLTIEDALEDLKSYLNVKELTILKSTEKYSSGLVLLSTNKKTASAVTKSFNIAKLEKRPHLIHWALTSGYPVQIYKQQRVGIKFLEAKDEEKKQPVILDEFSRRASLQKLVHPVHVEYRVLASNQLLPSALVEIAVSSVKWHFVRVYAASRIASIFGDIMYANRMNTLMGMPVKLHIQHAMAFDLPPLHDKVAEVLHLPSGSEGFSRIPTMLHLRSILLPKFRGGKDLTITAKLPPHFQWTTEQLCLLSCSI